MFVLRPTTSLNVAICFGEHSSRVKKQKANGETGRSCNRVATAWRRLDQAWHYDRATTVTPRQRRARSYARRVEEIR